MGAKISQIGSNTLHIEGVIKLGGGEFTVGPDYLEVISYVGAAVLTGGEITIRQAGPEYLSMIEQVFSRLGVSWEVHGEDLQVVFIGPCVAKKSESNEVDEGLTFKEVREMFELKDISNKNTD